ncbi:MAG: FKBP-type peptidyl-prolyl cis-trans isomerase [Prolixibacteraceae bacterium]|nr:FKBP-type peptidyl-prolyl cis-trans isomerase [Prolixibacteraceae bacterium]
MERMKFVLKILIIALFAGIFATGCNKNEDPYAGYTPAREAALIKSWLDGMVAKKLNIDTTSTGIFYVPDKVGTGATVKAGNKVTVKYTGMFLDGTVFDASALRGDGTMTYVHKTDRLIQGWEEGIEVLSKGGSAAFLIPSAKGYGATGYSTIPPYQPLIFIIEVVNIQ